MEKEWPWYLQSWFEEKPADYKYYDNDAKMFNEEFIPVMKKTIGTKAFKKEVIKYVSKPNIKRKQDLQITMTSIWIFHIQYYREQRGQKFVAEDVFKVRIPQEIKNLSK